MPSPGGGSVLQQVIAHNGQTNPPLFRAAMSSSTYLPSQHHFDDPVPEVRLFLLFHPFDSPYTYTGGVRVSIPPLCLPLGKVLIYRRHRSSSELILCACYRCADATDPLTCLRASNTSILQAANDKACRSAFYGTSVVVPVVDGEFITQRPSEALRQRRVNGVRTRINH